MGSITGPKRIAEVKPIKNKSALRIRIETNWHFSQAGKWSHDIYDAVVKQGSTILQKTIIPKKEYLETTSTLRGFKPVTSRIEQQF